VSLFHFQKLLFEYKLLDVLDFSGKLLSAYTNMNFNSEFKNRWSINGHFHCGAKYFNRLLRVALLLQCRVVKNESEHIHGQIEENFIACGNYENWGDLKSYRYQEYWIGCDFRPLNAMSLSFETIYGIRIIPCSMSKRPT